MSEVTYIITVKEADGKVDVDMKIASSNRDIQFLAGQLGKALGSISDDWDEMHGRCPEGGMTGWLLYSMFKANKTCAIAALSVLEVLNADL